MTAFIIRIYDYLRAHRLLRGFSLAAITIVLALLTLGQTYQEDISAFLPLGDRYHKAMAIYQETAGASRLFVTFQLKDSTATDPDALTAAMDDYAERLARNDREGMVRNLTAQIDIETFAHAADFAYRHIPYFLTDADYAHIDSLLRTDSFVARQLADDKLMLTFPAASLLSENIQRDPLNLFTPVVARLQNATTAPNYELYDGHIFTPDMSRSIVMLTSPFGASETEQNSRLLHLLATTADSTLAACPSVSIRTLGGPAIAVGNAQQIKRDSLLSVLLAVVLIVGLLYFSFRNLRNLLLIVVSIGWGWLFAMGALAVVHDSISVIVIGISSVILGISVNYPLHLIAHLGHTPNMRNALKEIVAPLLVGNITTVGAFLALVPLKSQALRDLGLFSSFLLAGTMIFVLLYLPHLAKAQSEPPASLARMGEVRLENKRWMVVAVVALTGLFGYYSLHTSFDANMSHMNYMTDEQRRDMAYFQQMVPVPDSTEILYLVTEGSTPDEALAKSAATDTLVGRLCQQGLVRGVTSCKPFLADQQEQARRLQRWAAFVARHRDSLTATLRHEAEKAGFSPHSFDDFTALLDASYEPLPASAFADFAATVFPSALLTDSTLAACSVVDQLHVAPQDLETVAAALESDTPGQYTFDVGHMNSAIANTLSDDFNYIGWACGLIVFFFLWFSLGSLELAMLSFLPMAISWIWILGIMALLHVQFNLVNVILATFIFGQGDDYTIFMTEGCQYEYAYRKKMIASYKNSIMISALIMFIGIGTLIFARHPALHSLAEVTIIGMFSVVLMAYLLPPLIFRWLVMSHGQYRLRPITLRSLMPWGPPRRPLPVDDRWSQRDLIDLVVDRYRYKGRDILASVRRQLARHDGYSRWLTPHPEARRIVVVNSQYGELALLLALTHRHCQVVGLEEDEDSCLVATYSAEGLADNLHFERKDADALQHLAATADASTLLFLLGPTPADTAALEGLNPTVVEP